MAPAPRETKLKSIRLSDADLARLKRVGYWRSSREPTLPRPSDHVDSTWDATERKRVIAYLEDSYLPGYLLFSEALCQLGCPDTPSDMGTQDRTDGTWLFPEGFVHYIRHHALKPPAEFLDHIRAAGYAVPRLTDTANKPTREPIDLPPVLLAPGEPDPTPPPWTPPPPNTTCFVCGAGAHSFFDSRARAACGACHHRTRLVDGGASLPEVLRSTRSSPLEGNGLNAVLNPVEIDGHRGWASFFGGSFQVVEEVHPSRDYFDFAAQHLEPGPTILQAVRSADLSPEADIKQLFRVLAALRSEYDMNQLFAALPYVTTRVEAAVAACLPITTNEQAWKAAEIRMAEDKGWSPEDHRSHIARIVALAERVSPEPG